MDEAIAPDGMVDIFAAAGLQKPNIAVLSDAFLDEVRNLPQNNLALEMLKKLLNDEISARQKTSIVQSRKFSERLEQSLNAYHNRGLEMAQIIDAMIQLAKEFKAAANKGEELGLKDDEYAFYEALAENASAQAVMQDDQLLTIAREVATTVRNNASIDWRHREQVRAKLRVTIRRVLNQHRYPPENRDEAVKLILEQAEALADDQTA